MQSLQPGCKYKAVTLHHGKNTPDMEVLSNFFFSFVATLCEMAPFLLIGFGFAGLLYAFLPKNMIQRYFGGSPLSSAIHAALLGVPLPLCSCGIIPTSMAFYKNGASKGGTVSLLIATPQTGVDSILATYSMMGLPFAVMRTLTAFLTGIAGGWAEGVRERKENRGLSGGAVADRGNEGFSGESGKAKGCIGRRLVIALKYGFCDFLGDIAKWLLIGLTLAAAVAAVVPENFIHNLNLPPIVQMLMVLAVAVPLYVCATGSIPLAASLIAVGLDPGAAFVFLMAGPATSIATITVLNRFLGKKTLVTYLTSIICGAMTGGLLITYALPHEWFVHYSNALCGNCADAGTSPVSVACGAVLAALIAAAFVRKRIQARSARTKMETNRRTMQTATFKVNNMTCSHCKANVEHAASNTRGVETATADLQSATVTVCGTSFNPQEVKNAIESAGYTVSQTR